jgi:putative Mg2+ transporter-C (MgtC) family protein
MSLPDPHAYVSHALQLLLAFFVGGVIGFERQIHGRPAGLRTHILVCVGAALIAMVDTLIPSSQGKITAQIVSGVGFLGAGAILRDGASVSGLTTAASVWCSAGMGIAIGTGGLSIWMALTAALIVLLTLTFIEHLERLGIHTRVDRELAIYIKAADSASGPTASSHVIDSLIHAGIAVTGVTTEVIDAAAHTKVIRVKLCLTPSGTQDSVSKALTDNPNVSQFVWVS